MDQTPLIDINRDASIEASKALSKFLKGPVSLGTVKLQIHEEFAVTIDQDASDSVYALSTDIVGDASGIAALCMPLSTACGLCDILFGREEGTTSSIDAANQDALLETGNIVIGNYLRAFVRAMPGTTLVHRSTIILSEIAANLPGRLAEAWKLVGPHDAMVIEVAFRFRHASLAGWVIILLEGGAIRKLMDRALVTQS